MPLHPNDGKVTALLPRCETNSCTSTNNLKTFKLLFINACLDYTPISITSTCNLTFFFEPCSGYTEKPGIRQAFPRQCAGFRLQGPVTLTGLDCQNLNMNTHVGMRIPLWMGILYVNTHFQSYIYFQNCIHNTVDMCSLSSREIFSGYTIGSLYSVINT